MQTGMARALKQLAGIGAVSAVTVGAFPVLAVAAPVMLFKPIVRLATQTAVDHKARLADTEPAVPVMPQAVRQAVPVTRQPMGLKTVLLFVVLPIGLGLILASV